MKTLIHTLSAISVLASINIGMAQPLDKLAIKAIDLQIAQPPFSKLASGDTNAMRAAVIANLSQWRFPLKAGNDQIYTHTLKVEIGESKYDQTPVGFSFTTGNADPRAPGFQKADVIPIQCRLSANANSNQQEQLDMTFSAPASSISSQQLQEKLVENISTVCYDLLDSINFLPPPTTNATTATVIKPTWMPSVQVETVPAAKPQPKIGNAPTTTMPAPAAEEGKKQVIIHNQGTPVILKFGYDRR